MAELIWEKQKTSSRGKASTHVRHFKVKGAASIGAAVVLIRASSNVPDSVSVVNPSGGTYELTGPEGLPEVECVELMGSRGIYSATVTWSHPESRRNERQGVQLFDAGDTSYQYTFSGRSVNELFAESTTLYDGTTNSSYDKAINFTPEKGVEGAPVDRPIGGIKISKLFGPDQIDGSWVNARRGIVHKKTNSATFEYAAAEEALLTSFNVTSKESGNWLAEFEFATGENQDNVTVSGIANVSFKAFDYVEVVSEKQVDDDEKIEKAVAKYVLVHKRHTTTSYATLLDPL